MELLTIQVNLHGAWVDAAVVEFYDPELGVSGKTLTSYDDDFFFEQIVQDTVNGDVIDCRALSIACPASLEQIRLKSWPSWLLDLMPQGAARLRIAKELGMRATDPAVELPLLRRAGGSPIGNLRIKEAWESEQVRIADAVCPPLTDQNILENSEEFIDVVERFGHLASGSSGVQGDWPKALMTRSSRDGCWYPDPFVRTEDGVEHLIVKLLRSSSEDDRLILEAEAPYLEVARDFGLRVARPLTYSAGVLQMPRFDREMLDTGVVLHGQESLISAMGIAEFAYRGKHEGYLELIQRVSDTPAEDTLEYVLRDVLNMAMGNPDNHGRNTAFAKRADQRIQLTPLFDFTPMKISDAVISRSTRWECLNGRDLEMDWGLVCDAAATEGLAPSDLRDALVSKIPFLRDLKAVALGKGVPQEVVNRAVEPDRVVAALEKLKG